MTMLNEEVIAIFNNGFLNISSHSVGSDASYQIFKFKKFIRETINKIQDSEKEILENSGLQDARNSENRLRELSTKKDISEEETKEMNELIEKFNEANSLMFNMHKDKVEVPNIKPLSYKEWYSLTEENKEKVINADQKIEVLIFLEDLLKDILWEDPE